ncbi:MAG: rod shape-determining protein MreD [Gemmatimonadota bacterium]
MASRSDLSFWVFFTLLVIAHFILHVALGLRETAPDLLTVALLLGVRRTRSSVAAAIGLLLGLLQDSLSLSAFGADAVVLTLLGYAGARSRDLFEGDSLLFVAAFLFIGKWLHDFGYWLLARDPSASGFVSLFLVDVPIAALYAAVAGVVALLLYRASTGER